MATIDASTFPDIGTAFGACGSGDTLFCPASTYTAPSGGLVITQPITIQGEPGTILQPFSSAQSVIDIQPPAGATLQRVYIRDLKLKNAVAATGVSTGNHGVKCVLSSASANTIVEWLEIRNVEAVGFGDTSFRFMGATSSNCVFIFPQLIKCTSDGSYGHGFLWESSSGANLLTNGRMETCFALNSQDQGCRCDAAIMHFEDCYWESNCRASSLSNVFGAQLRLRSGNFTVIGNTFEDFTTASQPSAKRGVVAENSLALTCWGNTFVNNAENADASQRCYYITGGGGTKKQHRSVIGPSRVSNTKTFIEVESTDSDMDIYLPFTQAGSTPALILPTTMHARSWT